MRVSIPVTTRVAPRVARFLLYGFWLYRVCRSRWHTNVMSRLARKPFVAATNLAAFRVSINVTYLQALGI